MVTPLATSFAPRIRFKVLTLAHAAAKKTALHYLQDIIQAYTPARPVRSAATGCLTHPSSRATVSRSSRLQNFSPVVERSPRPHKNWSLPSHLPPQLQEFPNLLSLPITVLSPCILFSTYKLYLSWYGSLTWPIQLVYLIHIHDLSTKSM